MRRALYLEAKCDKIGEAKKKESKMPRSAEDGIIVRKGDNVLFVENGIEYELASHPYEPCLYIKKDGQTIRTLHNAFDAYDLPERFKEGKTLLGIDGKMYDEKMFSKVLAAAIRNDRSEMDFTFAAGLAEKEEMEENRKNDSELEDVNGGLESEEVYDLKLGDEMYLSYDGQVIAKVVFDGVIQNTWFWRQNRVHVMLREVINSNAGGIDYIHYPDPYNKYEYFTVNDVFFAARGDLQKI